MLSTILILVFWIFLLLGPRRSFWFFQSQKTIFEKSSELIVEEFSEDPNDKWKLPLAIISYNLRIGLAIALTFLTKQYLNI